MKPNLLREKVEPKEDIDNFIFNWHNFPLDFWWRKKYNIPFGSQQHREMDFIDMLIEYREEIVVNRFKNEAKLEQDEQDNREIADLNKEVVHLSKEQIDDDYDSLDLSKF